MSLSLATMNMTQPLETVFSDSLRKKESPYDHVKPNLRKNSTMLGLKSQPPPIYSKQEELNTISTTGTVFPSNPHCQSKDIVFDVQDMWQRGTTTPIDSSETISDIKLQLALEKLAKLEKEVTHLKSINRTLEDRLYERNYYLYTARSSQQSYYYEYFFMVKQYTELQKKYFSHSVAKKRQYQDASTQMDAPIPSVSTNPPPRFNSIVPPTNVLHPPSPTKPEVNLGSNRNSSRDLESLSIPKTTRLRASQMRPRSISDSDIKKIKLAGLQKDGSRSEDEGPESTIDPNSDNKWGILSGLEAEILEIEAETSNTSPIM